jgi:hypothetical protein
MNKRAAMIAYELVMERNLIREMMAPLFVLPGDLKDASAAMEHGAAYIEAYKQCLTGLYRFIEPLLEGPEPDGIEWINTYLRIMAAKGFVDDPKANGPPEKA